MSFASFFEAYLEACLFYETGEDGEPLDERFSVDDIAVEAEAVIRVDCEIFYELMRDKWRGQYCGEPEPVDEDRIAGVDFYLTRNEHGAGFWDGDWREDAGEALTAAAERMGRQELYVGDDGRVWAFSS